MTCSLNVGKHASLTVVRATDQCPGERVILATERDVLRAAAGPESCVRSQPPGCAGGGGGGGCEVWRGGGGLGCQRLFLCGVSIRIYLPSIHTLFLHTYLLDGINVVHCVSQSVRTFRCFMIQILNIRPFVK